MCCVRFQEVHPPELGPLLLPLQKQCLLLLCQLTTPSLLPFIFTNSSLPATTASALYSFSFPPLPCSSISSRCLFPPLLHGPALFPVLQAQRPQTWPHPLQHHPDAKGGRGKQQEDGEVGDPSGPGEEGCVPEMLGQAWAHGHQPAGRPDQGTQEGTQQVLRQEWAWGGFQTPS